MMFLSDLSRLALDPFKMHRFEKDWQVPSNEQEWKPWKFDFPYLYNKKNEHETNGRTGKNLYFGLLNGTLKNIWFIRITGLLLNFRFLDWRFHYCQVKIRTQSTLSVQNQRRECIEILLVNALNSIQCEPMPDFFRHSGYVCK